MKRLVVYTDIGADPDDTAALAMLMHLHRRGVVRLLSVVCATARRDADRCLAAIAAYYGYDRPLGRMDGPAIPLRRGRRLRR